MIVLWILLLIPGFLFGDTKLQPVTGDIREEYIRKAQIWTKTDVPRMNIVAGPLKAIQLKSGHEVECEYVEPKELVGHAPKFLCKLNSGEIVRVKYGQENLEVFAEVAASRLFWTLGFFADEVYPARITCLKCPQINVSAPAENERRATRVFPDATIEPNFPGEILEESKDQGWQWEELKKIEAEGGGAPRAHIDALLLLSVFIQHSDSKPDNQRLACYQEDLQDADGDGLTTCDKPVMMIQDLGSAFGSGTTEMHVSRMNFESWKEKPIWDTAEEAKQRTETGVPLCIGNLRSSRAAGEQGLTHPVISEAGRKMLSDLLMQLTDQQILDIFRVARVDRLEQFINEGAIKRKVTAEDWASVFKQKRTEIAARSCE